MSLAPTTPRDPRDVALQIHDAEAVRIAEGVLKAVEVGSYKIASPEDREQANDHLKLLKAGADLMEATLTDTFRAQKQFERSVRDMLAPKIAALRLAAAKVDRAMHEWRRAEQERIKAETARAHDLAQQAAQAAAEQPLLEDEEPIAPAQIVTPELDRVSRGAVGKTHETRRVVALEIVDAATVLKHWPDAIRLDGTIAKAHVDALVKAGMVEWPPETPATVVINGVRFSTAVTFASGRV